MHYTFLSNRGIYILVIDLSLDLQDAVTNLRTDSSGKEVPDNGCPKTVEGISYLEYHNIFYLQQLLI